MKKIKLILSLLAILCILCGCKEVYFEPAHNHNTIDQKIEKLERPAFTGRDLVISEKAVNNFKERK